jgi:hypothetical protein
VQRRQNVPVFFVAVFFVAVFFVAVFFVAILSGATLRRRTPPVRAAVKRRSACRLEACPTWPEQLQQLCMCEQLVSHGFGQRLELVVEDRMKQDGSNSPGPGVGAPASVKKKPCLSELTPLRFPTPSVIVRE